MKHLFTFLLFTLLSFQANAQTLFDEDFETGYTAGNTAIAVEPLMLQGWGTDFTYQTVYDAGNGASSSDFFVRMVRGGTTNYAVIQNVVALESGKTYEYKISIKPASNQAGAYKLQVIDTSGDDDVIVAGGTAGVKPTTASWNDLTISYIAGASQNYVFRITKSWGNAGADFDNISLVCTDCSTASVSKTNDFQFNIYPNPAKDVISFQSELPLASVEIFSLTGSKVLSQSNNVRQVEVGNLAKGIYMLKASAVDGKVATQKLIKE
jgi:hypothetical protein